MLVRRAQEGFTPISQIRKQRIREVQQLLHRLKFKAQSFGLLKPTCFSLCYTTGLASICFYMSFAVSMVFSPSVVLLMIAR